MTLCIMLTHGGSYKWMVKIYFEYRRVYDTYVFLCLGIYFLKIPHDHGMMGINLIYMLHPFESWNMILWGASMWCDFLCKTLVYSSPKHDQQIQAYGEQISYGEHRLSLGISHIEWFITFIVHHSPLHIGYLIHSTLPDVVHVSDQQRMFSKCSIIDSSMDESLYTSAYNIFFLVHQYNDIELSYHN